ncbi:hypothetical protein [Metabacillus litoralis]|uniref:hypothetical protein n=1 Tax=Metabacillus litoralis TaxID=152268 RepID=UPI0013CF10EB|nr:hypothetical protein [Metabacillus litoralis]
MRMCLDIGRIGTERRAGSEKCVSIVAESGQKRERSVKMSLDIGRIGTERRVSNEYVSR